MTSQGNRQSQTERGLGGDALSPACSPGGGRGGRGVAAVAAGRARGARPAPSALGDPKPSGRRGPGGKAPGNLRRHRPSREGLKGPGGRGGTGRDRASIPGSGALLWILMVSKFMAAARHLHAGSAPDPPARASAVGREPVPARSLRAGRG